ncbi:1-deoxy-D-xylulose-5-phosphate synthase [uncultured Cetobacterium sp.]|uniref:1-deoxy-D-xylulose-5-phosphate synthase n=1 Tax=uncultured Cetobacterium sp. TaxID=527638 RepID=UPI002611B534|nr:1-deoxy-D-xylulose-5-phosphate synthase [uncultured Cetobacterium sp.]
MKLDKEYIEKLQKESEKIRETLVETTSKNGGHLAPNLGIVELTQAIHEVFNLPKDKLLFDVGHQSYVHKLLTGRDNNFKTLRTKGGIGPFLDPKESKYDFFIAGHAGSALSAGAGIAVANPKDKVIVVVGDASIANGNSLEALNNIGENIKNIIVILNDNEMSIGKNVGSLSSFFGRLMVSNTYMSIRNDIRGIVSKGKVGNQVKNFLERIETSVKQFFLPSSISEVLGYQFLGVIDGHNLEDLVKTLEAAKEMEGPVFIHVKTEKGKGYQLAEENKEKFHGISPFNPKTGEVKSGDRTYSNIFGIELVRIAEKDEDIFAISAAMIKGTGLGKFKKEFPNRCIDVGIAEGHAVTFAGGLAISGKKPYIAIYSTFFQRALDQMIHDVALQNLPVRFIVDRAGIVGEDGKTHQGIHDLRIFLGMPNYTVLAPTTGTELEDIIKLSGEFNEGPLVVRFPRGTAYEMENKIKFKLGKWNEIISGNNNLYLATGAMLKELLEIKDQLKDKNLDGTIVSCTSIRPLDEKYILSEFSKYENIFTFEDAYEKGGFGTEILEFINEKKINIKINIIGLDNISIPHGSRNILLEDFGLRGQKLIERIEEKINGKK